MLMRHDRRSQLDGGDGDLSKLELVDFFPFTDRKKHILGLSPAKGLTEYTSRFEQFASASESEQNQQQLGTYENHPAEHGPRERNQYKRYQSLLLGTKLHVNTWTSTTRRSHTL